MTEKIRVSIVGASGYVGGELLRLLLQHPNAEVNQVTSERFAAKPVTVIHPNLRTQTDLKFCSVNDLEKVDLMFIALPHAKLMNDFDKFSKLAERIIDLSADFRLKNPEDYKEWYDVEHPRAELLNDFVYGIVELHREEMKKANYISSAGCNATATILPLYPLFKNNLVDLSKPVIAEAKCGSSEGGNKFSEASHHPERSGCVRSYKPSGHRHTAEMIQELGNQINFSATSIEMVRGILLTAHVFLKQGLTELDVWKAYRKEYGDEPFIRIVKERTGIYRYPEPKILSGSNFCDIGFALDEKTGRLVVIGAIDNLMKGAAGQAVHAMNVMLGFDEKMGLEFMGLHPI
ncbi:MAG: N-acetyl-gamma-glutamyl-phosphate reductase [Nanoarchaeota archaeon]|nr:N-acetyl-gamma-glutamyl-phosphate reductase [Nanoarchaeota archaeon]MBU1321263.1 N-acetyl-gamma-glutamyl-phosphate reductase [Nanoarchaeota archaeon]MBU1597334.1 N-acetyl-gamma-glutamyl-phosphate reductase [Nanoarchaeota archaeon]MBU2441457.1 N-acetyl-gamma-glutamyl-phosphate reductase [Nanoarchaeota archaeon]